MLPRQVDDEGLLSIFRNTLAGGFKGCAQLLGELTRFKSTEKETEWESLT
jgi:hypothetical protein